MRMDPYGRMVDSLTDLWESLDDADVAKEAAPVRKALEKAMAACVEVERLRRSRTLAPEALVTMSDARPRRAA